MIRLPGGLLKGGGPAPTDLATSNPAGTGFSTYGVSDNNNIQGPKDWRVRIALPPNSRALYKDGGASKFDWPLKSISEVADFDGVIFPYTPQLTVQHNARYQEQPLTHANFKSYAYEGSDLSPISIAGVFTCQNQQEAIYVMSCLMFLRACTRMNFGNSDPNAGRPPTLVRLSGYGDLYLPQISCVVTSVSHTMPDDVDYIAFDYYGNGAGRMPTMSTITVTLQPVISRDAQANNFDLEAFARGELVGTYNGKAGIL